MKKDKKTIFEELFEKKSCFAVILSVNISKLKGMDFSEREYLLLITSAERLVLTYSFKKNKDYAGLYEHKLTDLEILEFKKNIEHFIKVQHDQNGRVYELKNNSFKHSYKSQYEFFY
ncbi:MAG TPA: hypothetical protein VNG53_01030 [Bacteroidia bacterium]|nr:hypothetical protein [Bacteroidia bacterium]